MKEGGLFGADDIFEHRLKSKLHCFIEDLINHHEEHDWLPIVKIIGFTLLGYDTIQSSRYLSFI